ncbi:hypothetical protein acsn021_18170 [Anaerocolumna cellulosilytica]|uniref:Uncharacterized protein n=1 Tax=Anaerocolumna cellulosilytica TaxID=433286 RepID=A0A6S6R5B5_9FIRM|nr:hypothetical protein [Anaerocolumna cellulosilytica]MBB5194789.1 hypothetical protein [Anaerocolumna cellulosilytica]BCJ94248.1 hypothetical protein acsn021_18170 [Anaerocolumna cellulosilytica]
MPNKILPQAESFITTYPKDTNALSILLQHKEALGWLMNCFIQLTSYDNTYLDYYDFYYRNCPILDVQRIKKSIIGEKPEDVINFIIEAIEKKYYIYLLINTKYIPKYQSKKDWVHDLFVYGYNRKDELFYIADNFDHGKYGKATCTFQELEKAIRYFPQKDFAYQGFRNCIELLSYNKEPRARLEPYRINLSIEDYLESNPTRGWYVNNAMWDEEETRKRTFGITCYNTIYNHLEFAHNKGYFGQGSNQAFFLMWEHKKTMTMRLRHLRRLNLLKEEECISQYMKLEEQALIALSLKLKYTVKSDDRNLISIRSYYDTIKETEEKVLNKLLIQLKEI